VTPDKPKTIPLATEESKQQRETFYAEEDSDNDSDFEVKYEQPSDAYEDLKPTKKPLFLSDLVLCLQSDSHERFRMGVEAAEELVRTAVDLEVQAVELLQAILRVQNRFSVEEFAVKKYKTVQSMVERVPKLAIELVKRVLDEECSLGEKLLLVEVLGNASLALSNEADAPTPSYHLEDSYNRFFETPSLFDTPMTILGTLTRKLSPSKQLKGQLNHFHAVAESFITPALHLFRSPFVLRTPLLLGKTVFTLSLMLESAANHLRIEAFSRESFQVWRRLKGIGSYEVDLNFAFLLSKLKRLNPDEREEARAWLEEQLETHAGNQTFVEVGALVARLMASAS